MESENNLIPGESRLGNEDNDVRSRIYKNYNSIFRFSFPIEVKLCIRFVPYLSSISTKYVTINYSIIMQVFYVCG